MPKSGKEKVIYWQAHGDRLPCRSGTILPERGESWEHMAIFLGNTDPGVHIYAYVYDLDGHRADEREGSAEEAKTWTWD